MRKVLFGIVPAGRARDIEKQDRKQDSNPAVSVAELTEKRDGYAKRNRKVMKRVQLAFVFCMLF
jgi:hypothetical protein